MLRLSQAIPRGTRKFALTFEAALEHDHLEKAERRTNLSSIRTRGGAREMSTDHKIFELKSAPLQSGVDFRDVKISYKTYGQLAADKSNVVVVPSGYTLTHDEVDWLTSAGKVLVRAAGSSSPSTPVFTPTGHPPWRKA
jgi:hypothetical protein